MLALAQGTWDVVMEERDTAFLDLCRDAAIGDDSLMEKN